LFGSVELSLVFPSKLRAIRQSQLKLIFVFPWKIEEGVFSMKHNKVSWPDGFLIGFYQNFSDLLADDIFRMFSDFYMKEKLIFVDSNGTIILIAKGKGPGRQNTNLYVF
jgi:hypothetical protein